VSGLTLELLPSRSKITYCKFFQESIITSPQSLELSVFFWREGSKIPCEFILVTGKTPSQRRVFVQNTTPGWGGCQVPIFTAVLRERVRVVAMAGLKDSARVRVRVVVMAGLKDSARVRVRVVVMAGLKDSARVRVRVVVMAGLKDSARERERERVVAMAGLRDSARERRAV
jgi:hypothetical protein